MKVEFSVDEVWQMMDSVVDQFVDLDISKQDRAALRRWRSDEMSPGSPALGLLTEKVNEALADVHSSSEVSPIKKPDWV